MAFHQQSFSKNNPGFKSNFENATRLFATNGKVDEYNSIRLQEINSPVTGLVAVNLPNSAKNLPNTPVTFLGDFKTFYLCALVVKRLFWLICCQIMDWLMAVKELLSILYTRTISDRTLIYQILLFFISLNILVNSSSKKTITATTFLFLHWNLKLKITVVVGFSFRLLAIEWAWRILTPAKSLSLIAA